MNEEKEIANAKVGIEEQYQARYDVLIDRLIRIGESGRMSFYPDDVRTKRVTVTRIEVGLGRTFWQDDGGELLVPSGFIRAEEVTELLKSVKGENNRLREMLKYSELEIKDREGRITGITSLVGRLEGKLEIARADLKEARKKTRKTRKRPDPMTRVK